MLNLALQHRIGRQPDGVEVALGFEELVHLWVGEASVTAEQFLDLPGAVAGDHRFKHAAPVVGAGDVAVAQEGAFQVAVLVEAEQRVVAVALEVAVVRRAFLLAVGFTDRTVQVEDDAVLGPVLLNVVRSTGPASSSSPRGSLAASRPASRSGPSDSSRRPPSAWPDHPRVAASLDRPRVVGHH